MTSKIVESDDKEAIKTAQSLHTAAPKRKPRVTAKGAVLCAVPIALLATWIIVLKFGLSYLWLIPIYAALGALLALVLLFV